MGIRECREINGLVSVHFDGDPDNICAPLAVLESLPEGMPSPDCFPAIAANILEYLHLISGLTDEEVWPLIGRWFNPKLKPRDIEYRTVKDNDLPPILRYAYSHQRPVIYEIPTDEGYHTIGSHFVRLPKEGIVSELISGKEGDRPYIPLSGKLSHDQHGELEALYNSGRGSLIIFPKL